MKKVRLSLQDNSLRGGSGDFVSGKHDRILVTSPRTAHHRVPRLRSGSQDLLNLSYHDQVSIYDMSLLWYLK